MNETTFSLPLVHEAQYSDLRKAWQGDALPVTYQAWMTQQNARLEKLREKGVLTRVVPIEVSDLLLWCRQREREVDLSSLTEYTASRPRDVRT